MAAPQGEWSTVVQVVTGRVVFADHELLAYDIPELAPLSDAARMEWLLSHAGIVSRAQLWSEAANTPIDTDGEERLAWRPSRYGRAVIAPAGPTLLDVKGAGVASGRRPSRRHHGSGLCALRDVLREALFTALVDAILARAAPDLWTVPIYGAIDLGFDVITRAGEQIPAGVLVRRAHARDDVLLPERGTTEERLQVEIELLLRHYGVTTSNAGTRYVVDRDRAGLHVAYAGETPEPAAPRIAEALGDTPLPVACDGVNVQLALPPPLTGVRCQLVDFGHYEVRHAFARTLVSTVCDAPHHWGATVLPTDPHFVAAPNPSLELPPEQWARMEEAAAPGGGVTRRDVDPPTRWAHGAALRFRSGAATGDDIAAEIVDKIRAAVRP